MFVAHLRALFLETSAANNDSASGIDRAGLERLANLEIFGSPGYGGELAGLGGLQKLRGVSVLNRSSAFCASERALRRRDGNG